MGYRLTCRYDEKSGFDNPLVIVSLMVPIATEPVLRNEVALTRQSLDKAMAAAQKWMLENVYTQPCATKAEAKARELDTGEVDNMIRMNFPRPKQDVAISLVRLAQAANKMNLNPVHRITFARKGEIEKI